ncbi:MAG: hypothetical protein JST51_01625 [Armatimonadetes bacterium]|nr:hypothetical protein [Armatimonadota bacterium]
MRGGRLSHDAYITAMDAVVAKCGHDVAAVIQEKVDRLTGELKKGTGQAEFIDDKGNPIRIRRRDVITIEGHSSGCRILMARWAFDIPGTTPDEAWAQINSAGGQS